MISFPYENKLIVSGSVGTLLKFIQSIPIEADYHSVYFVDFKCPADKIYFFSKDKLDYLMKNAIPVGGQNNLKYFDNTRK